ncbi:MAG: hypothetical protein OXG09_02490 [Chloroflexi bacterium]|nr:hypothetical protein [Chloroflexota bacterium]
METLFDLQIVDEQTIGEREPAMQFHDLIIETANICWVNDFWEHLAQAPFFEPLYVATDPDGVAVHLSREQWENHIQARHPQVAHYREHIFRAIETPDLQYYEGKDDKNRYFIRYYANIPDHSHSYSARKRVVVVVKYTYGENIPGQYSGLLSTAYLETW